MLVPLPLFHALLLVTGNRWHSFTWTRWWLREKFLKNSLIPLYLAQWTSLEDLWWVRHREDWPQSGCLSVFTLLTGGLFTPFCRSRGEQGKQLPIWQQRVPGGAAGATTPAGRAPLEGWNRNRRTDKIKVHYHSWKEQQVLRRHAAGTQGTGESGVTVGKCRELSAPFLFIFFWFFWRK